MENKLKSFLNILIPSVRFFLFSDCFNLFTFTELYLLNQPKLAYFLNFFY